MELSENILDDESLKVWTAKGELLPDPNLIRNIDHLFGFIKIELEQWGAHCSRVEEQLHGIPNILKAPELLKDSNTRIYIKSLFDISTYYIACVQALDRLISQLYKLSTEYYQLKIKKPKLEINKAFHEKAQFIRDKSFIHQDSDKVQNPMDKRVAMSWTPPMVYKSDETPSCEGYEFASIKCWVKINGEKTESKIDITKWRHRYFSLLLKRII